MSPSKPLGVISPADQSGLILILTSLALCFVIVSFGIRIYIRVPQRLWKWDDNILSAATALSCVQTAIVYYEVHLGLGKRRIFDDDQKNESLKRYYFANDFLYLVVLLFSKAAVGSLFLRLTRRRGHIITIWSILGLCGAWFLLSILLISIGSSWQKAFVTPFGRWLGVGITDSITEVVFVLMAAFLVSDLRMSKVQKATVIFAFGLRLLAIPAAGIRLYYLNPSTLPDNHSMAISLAVVCTQIQLGYGIMAASVTVLKPFMVVYEKPTGYTGYLTGPTNKAFATNNSEHASFKMKSVIRSGEAGDRLPSGNDPMQTYSSYNATAAGNAKRGSVLHEKDDSIHSHDSRRMIIERKTDWSVRYEEAESHKSNASEAAGSV